MTLLNSQGNIIPPKLDVDKLPVMTCQAQRPKSIEDQETIITCHSQIFLMGAMFKFVEKGLLDKDQEGLIPQQIEVCAICGAINSKGVDKEMNGLSEAIEEGKGRDELL